MLLRRIIVILCILAILPTTVDPSCVGYFVYGELELPVQGRADGLDGLSGRVERADRPIEVLAATRIPTQVSIAPLAVVDLWLRFLARAPRDAGRAHADSSPAFLASSLHDSFLRHAVLLI